MAPSAKSGKSVSADSPDPPEKPLEACQDKAGKISDVESEPADKKQTELSSQTIGLQEANKDGKPFCKKCEEAKKEK